MGAIRASKVPLLLNNDHRAIGLRQKLFVFHDYSQGSCFFLPRGAHIYNKLVDYLRNEYKKRRYHEIITPNLYKSQLWKQSGHWDHYKENMIRARADDKTEWSLKPMNCPGHCLLFQQQKPLRKSSQLPVRWADFGVLHRNELSGSLLGLTRQRKFQQDDAHIFCTPQQVEKEVQDCLTFAREVYHKFGFKFTVKLSLRPESYLGEPALWDMAENSLRNALRQADLSWQEQEFEGAFYGPKIDLDVSDCRDRTQQCATIQLDFQLPERFNLQYRDDSSTTSDDQGSEVKRPVIIHRAILGSIERFMAMLAENCNGRWPFWLSPVQAQVVPTHSNLNSYAQYVSDYFSEQGLWVDCDTRESTTFKAKIRDAYMTPYNLIFIVGEKESDTKTVSCRLIRHTTDDDCANARQFKDSSNTVKSSDSYRERSAIHTFSLSLKDMADRLVEFEKRGVDQAHLELLNQLKLAGR